MIQITAYLRTEEDLAKWKAIENKAEFMHRALAQAPLNALNPSPQFKPIKTTKDLDLDAIRKVGKSLDEAVVPANSRWGIDNKGRVRQFTDSNGNPLKTPKDAEKAVNLSELVGKGANIFAKPDQPIPKSFSARKKK